MENEILEYFYVTTLTSVYRVVIDGKNGPPFFTKIVSRGENQIPVGTIFNYGTMVAICCSLIMFDPEGDLDLYPGPSIRREILTVNTHFWGKPTSMIVGLFLEEYQAMKCHMSDVCVACDPRWKKETIEVLKQIGNNHPYCSISSNSEEFWLLPPSDWQN